MSSKFRIRQGGMIRQSFPVVTDSAAYECGNVMEVVKVDTIAEAQLGSGATACSIGLAIDPDPRTTTTRLSSGGTINRVDGTPSGDQVSLLMDEAIVEDDEIASGIVFEINNKVYYNSGGHLTTASSNAKVIGRALSKAVGNNGDTLTFFYSVQLDQE